MKKLIAILTLGSALVACNSSNNNTNSDHVDSTEETTSVDETGGAEEEPSSTTSQKVGVEGDSIFVYADGTTMQDMKFRPGDIILEKGKNYTLVLVNTGDNSAMVHNFVIVEKGTGDAVGKNGMNYKDEGYVRPNDINVLANSPVAQPGETVYLSLTMEERGNYDFICSYPGHWGRMNGTLTVE